MLDLGGVSPLRPCAQSARLPERCVHVYAGLDEQRPSSPRKRPEQRPSPPRKRLWQPLDSSSAMARLGVVSGSSPNVHWRGITMEELRTHPRFISLPPASDVRLAGPETFHYVRQDEPLWDELHDGVLTSRYLLGALGMREPEAARALGLPRAVIQPGAIAETWRALRMPVALHTVARLRDRADAEVRAAHTANRKVIAALSRRGRHRGARPMWWPPRSSHPPPEYDAARLRDSAQTMAEGGIHAVRCAWGSAQEAAAIAAVLDALPREARIEEIGLSMLRPKRGLGRRLRAVIASLGELPPIGVSPDAMLRMAPGAPRMVVEVKNVSPFFALRGTPAGMAGASGASGASGAKAATGATDAAGKTAAHGRGSLSQVAHRQFQVLTRYVPRGRRGAVNFFWLRAPHERLPCQYVPQIQMQMLVTGTAEALYVCGSACQGINLIRVRRDDEYLGELLTYLAAFWTTVRHSDAPPPDDYFARPAAAAKEGAGGARAASERYERFLARTRAISEQSCVSQHLPKPWRRPSHGSLLHHFFIDSVDDDVELSARMGRAPASDGD